MYEPNETYKIIIPLLGSVGGRGGQTFFRFYNFLRNVLLSTMKC